MNRRISVTLLGPWEVRVEGGAVHVPAGRLRILSTSLMIAAGEPVGLDELADRLWPEQLPANARGTIHTYIGRLRKLLGTDLVRTHPAGGYLLDITAESVDLHRFRALLVRAEQAGTPEAELKLLCEALALWRGRPFVDMYSTWLDREVLPRLTEEWYAATARRIDLELAIGVRRPDRLIAELRELTTRYPTRESQWQQLITALHLGGRRAEALATYQQVRALLSDELGIDPSERLVATQQAILLDGTPDPTAAVALPRTAERGPRQLPHDVATFTGRHGELARLDTLLDRLDHPGPAIVSIDGAPGVGKTAMAVHWAHQIAHRYPDAQLYLNLHGFGPTRPISSKTAAARLLRALGGLGEIVAGSAEDRFAALRTALAGRKALILLDNARDSEQVRPLLPGCGGLVIVTSRNQLRGLSVRDGAHRVTLHRLSPNESVALLAAAAGRGRVTARPAAAARLTRLCDRLPLALAILAERAHRTDSLADIVSALECAPLDTLSTNDGDPHTDLRSVLSWSYHALRPDAAAMFRALGRHRASDIGPRTAAALADMPMSRAQATLDALAAAHLLEQHRPDRYTMPALILLYATEVATTLPRRRPSQAAG